MREEMVGVTGMPTWYNSAYQWRKGLPLEPTVLGKTGGNAATGTSSYHGDDNEDDDDLNYDDDHDDDDHDDDGDNDGYDMMTMTAVVLKRPAKSVRCRRILQMTIMAHTGIIPQLAHHTWIMCQINCQ